MSEYAKILKDPESRRELCIEQTIVNVTELICQHMHENGMKKRELAHEMGVSAGRVTQLLDGHANMTLRSVARALAVFGHVLCATSKPIEASVSTADWSRKPDLSRASAVELGKACSTQSERAESGVFQRVGDMTSSYFVFSGLMNYGF